MLITYLLIDTSLNRFNDNLKNDQQQQIELAEIPPLLL